MMRVLLNLFVIGKGQKTPSKVTAARLAELNLDDNDSEEDKESNQGMDDDNQSSSLYDDLQSHEDFESGNMPLEVVLSEDDDQKKENPSSSQSMNSYLYIPE
jgi:hypothetical protein